MEEKAKGTWRRTVNRYVGLGSAILGMAIIMSSFLFLDNLFVWYATVILGLLVVLGGFLYGAHPFLTSERRHFELRAEVDRFIGLVRKLNSAAMAADSEEEFERLKSQMMASVERMGELAGKEG